MKSLDEFQDICNEYAFGFYECAKIHGKTLGGDIGVNMKYWGTTQVSEFIRDKRVQKIIRNDLFPNGNVGNYGVDQEVIIITPFNKLIFKGWRHGNTFFEVEILDKDIE